MTPNNLPAELTSFVGREQQLAELRRLLRRTRLITLTGPGGVGKTRLALRLISGVLDRYPGGAWVVELAAIGDAAALEHSLAAACGVREAANRTLAESIIEQLRAAPAVVILDGAEHLVASTRELVERLLRAVTGLTFVVTSREPLGASGETVWQTLPLTLPGAGDHASSEAVRLFLARATLIRPGFSLDRESVGALADICIRLDGLPLAIELAASIIGVMSVKEIAARLADREALRHRDRRAMPRYEALDRAIDSSYRLLTAAERQLFIRLAIFNGGFDAQGAEAIGSMDGEDVMPTLVRLVDKSLVVAATRGDGRTRYRLLDTIREFALARMPPAQARLARQRHASHYLAFAETAAAELRFGHQASWLERTEEEMPNLQLAFAWYGTESPDAMAKLAGHLARFWYVRGKLSEGLEWLDRALESPAVDPRSRLLLLQNRARLRRHRGDYQGARLDAEACIELARLTGDDLHVMGGFVTIGNLSASLGQWDEAEQAFARALEYQWKTKDQALVAGGLNNLALVESARGDNEAAKERIDQALELAESADDRILQATIRESAGRIERRHGNRAAARAHYLKALELSAEFEDLVNIADVLDGMSLLALAERDPNRSLTLAAASRSLRSSVHSEPQRWDHREVDEGVARARSQLRAPAATGAWGRGSAMGLRDAVAFASGVSAPRRATGTQLSPREMQVAALIAEGLTNAELAARLRMAGRTADAHVEHIRNKLGLHTRAQIAVWAHDRSETAAGD